MTDLDAILVTPTTPLRIKMSDTPSVAPVRAAQRDAAVVTAVHVARDFAIERMGDTIAAAREVQHYMIKWLMRNGADLNTPTSSSADVFDILDAVWGLADLPGQDSLALVDDDYRGTSDEARAMLTAQYEADLTHALSRITWKD